MSENIIKRIKQYLNYENFLKCRGFSIILDSKEEVITLKNEKLGKVGIIEFPNFDEFISYCEGVRDGIKLSESNTSKSVQEPISDNNGQERGKCKACGEVVKSINSHKELNTYWACQNTECLHYLTSTYVIKDIPKWVIIKDEES